MPGIERERERERGIYRKRERKTEVERESDRVVLISFWKRSVCIDVRINPCSFRICFCIVFTFVHRSVTASRIFNLRLKSLIPFPLPCFHWPL